MAFREKPHQQLRQLAHTDLGFVITQVIRHRRIAPQQDQQGPHHEIGKVTEGAARGSRTAQADVPAGNDVGHEVSEHAAVVQGHAGAVGVKDTDDLGGDPVLVMPRHTHGLRDPLGLGVAGTQFRRIHAAAVVFGSRNVRGIGPAVDLGAAHEKHSATAALPRHIKEIAGADNVRQHDAHRVTPIETRTGPARAVNDEIHRTGVCQRIADILKNEMQVFPILIEGETPGSLLPTATHADHLYTKGVLQLIKEKQCLNQICRKKTVRPGNQYCGAAELLPRQCSPRNKLHVLGYDWRSEGGLHPTVFPRTPKYPTGKAPLPAHQHRNAGTTQQSGVPPPKNPIAAAIPVRGAPGSSLT